MGWLKDIGDFLVEHKGDIEGIYASCRDKLFGRNCKIAITGMEGVGKTVLLDALTGKADQPGYTLPSRSQKSEPGKAKAGDLKLVLETVPGQQSSPRVESLNKLFLEKKAVDGVIHVVGGGFASVRVPDEQRLLIQDKKIETVEAFRTFQRKVELADLEETCRRIQDSHDRHHAPKWLVVAVDKIDLYHDEVDSVVHGYSPSSRSEFATLLERMREQVGYRYFRWGVLPISGFLDTFSWNGHTVKPQIDGTVRKQYLAHFLHELSGY